jgi:hypothetical protein
LLHTALVFRVCGPLLNQASGIEAFTSTNFSSSKGSEQHSKEAKLGGPQGLPLRSPDDLGRLLSTAPEVALVHLNQRHRCPRERPSIAPQGIKLVFSEGWLVICASEGVTY